MRTARKVFGSSKIKDFIENFDNFTENEWEKSQSAQLGSVRPWHIVQADEKLNDSTAPGVFGGVGVYCGSENGVDYYTTLYRQMNLPKKFRLKTRFCFGVYAGGYGSQGGDCHEFISKYDRAETLFYLDPPYWGCENDYGKNIFEKADFEKLAKQLKTIRGKFILSLNDVQQIRQIFKAFHIKEVQTKYTITINAPKPTTELLISNVDLDRL